MQNLLNIKRYGNGANKLVAIHGLGSGSSAWDLVQPNFEEATEFITLDLPGHGDAAMRANLEMNPARLAEIIKEELASQGINDFHRESRPLYINKTFKRWKGRTTTTGKSSRHSTACQSAALPKCLGSL